MGAEGNSPKPPDSFTIPIGDTMTKAQIRTSIASLLSVVTMLQNELDTEASHDSTSPKEAPKPSQGGMFLNIKETAFETPSGRGRKQIHPILTLKPFDLSETNRKKAFQNILGSLGLPEKTQIIKHAKLGEGHYIIKDTSKSVNYTVSIRLPKKEK